MRRPLIFPEEGVGDAEITLRRHRETDVPALTAACQDPDIQRFTRVPTPYTEDDARGWVVATRVIAKEGTALHLVAVDIHDDVVGAIAVQGIDDTNRRAEIGYWVAPWGRGKGVATRAVRILSGWAFEALSLERISIFAEPGNAASRGVAEAAGFTPEGVLENWIEVAGEQRDVVAHRMTREELARDR